MQEYGEINDISGIVNDISNIEDTSFQITIDTFNKRLGNDKPRNNLQINTCKSNYYSMTTTSTTRC